MTLDLQRDWRPQHLKRSPTGAAAWRSLHQLLGHPVDSALPAGGLSVWQLYNASLFRADTRFLGKSQ